ncbi:MAG: bifunctional lysylphosphatidylglycerol synthetase/lysine--tRNA ligase LysX [Actinobacteria bacterium]|nr:bifunctional lysylphosphatidylglycerol synthetase/lysine--tRNA ligase LysX [Actinomycetota bacterium]
MTKAELSTLSDPPPLADFPRGSADVDDALGLPSEGSQPRRAVTTKSSDERVAGWIGRIVTIGAIWSLITVILPRWRLLDVVNHAFWLVNVPVGRSLFTVVLLLMLGNVLRRRLRFGLMFFLWLFQGLSALAGLIVLGVLIAKTQINDVEIDLNGENNVFVLIEGAVGLILFIWLWRLRRLFPAHLTRANRVRALVALVVGMGISIAVSIALVEAYPRQLEGAAEKLGWAISVAFGLAPDSSTDVFHDHRGYHWISALVGVVSAIALLVAALILVRAARKTQYLSATDELQVRRLLLEAGERDSLGYFATRRDKAAIFSPDGRAAVTYRVVASVSLASGDPVGHVGSWAGAIEAWRAEAREFGWFPAVLAASEEGARAYLLSGGLHALSIGDEAVVDVGDFSIEGRAMRPVRQAVMRVRRAGYTVAVRRHSEISAEELAEIDRLAEQWRGDQTERGFSMALGRMGDPTDGRCVLVTAHDLDGRVRGLLSFIPWGVRGVSLDLMRRDKSAENGLTEFMVAGLVEACPDLGVRHISLNFAMFRGIFEAAESVGAGPITRLTNASLSVASRFWQLETLYKSNAKYLPRWVPRFLVFDSGLTLTRTGLAAGMAEGFVPSPAPRVSRTPTDTVVVDGATSPFTDVANEQEAELLRPAVPEQRLSEQQRARLMKLVRLADDGVEAYPVGVPRTISVAELRAAYPGLPVGEITNNTVSIAGRVRAVRDFGGLMFATIQDDGAFVQAVLSVDRIDPAGYRRWKRTVDLGDHVSVTGVVGRSDLGELSVFATDWMMAAKCLRPLPDVHAGFADPDAKLRQRYLDLLVNEDSRDILRKRMVAVRSFRTLLAERDFVEVETPMLQAVHGGANARPFTTHINAYDMQLYLRIAPELYLKRLCVAGFSKIFEMNRNFRNEGADSTHNPEFTSIELYQAYADYNSMQELTRELILGVATAVHGEPVAHRVGADGQPYVVRLDQPWRAVSVHEAVSEACGEQITSTTPADQVRAICERLDIHAPAGASAGYLVLELYDELVEGNTVEPTFYRDFPVETSPLTRVHRTDPQLSERWDLVAFGAEIGTAYSELIDPIDQRQRLTEQSLLAANGDPEAMQVDEAFLTALEYSMPPTGGLGIGVDRLVMMLVGATIRPTLAFPFVRPQAQP